jgi:FtsX-like permease family
MSWDDDPEAEVVGVVGDVRLTSLDTAARHTLYWSQEQVPNSFMTLMVRASGPPESLIPAVRSVVAALDPELPPGRFRSLEEIVEGSLERQRFLLRLLAAFAVVAMLLAAVGVYGVMSYAVIERVPEVGVRLAVGASPRDIVRLVLRDGLVLGLAGVAIGMVVAAAGAGALRSLLFEVARAIRCRWRPCPACCFWPRSPPRGFPPAAPRAWTRSRRSGWNDLALAAGLTRHAARLKLTRRARRRRAAAAACEGGFRGGRERPSRVTRECPP